MQPRIVIDFWKDDLSDYLMDLIEESGYIYLYRRTGNLLYTHLYWDYDNRMVEFAGSVYLPKYMETELNLQTGELLKENYALLYSWLGKPDMQNTVSFLVRGKDKTKNFLASVDGLRKSITAKLDEGEISFTDYGLVLQQIDEVADHLWDCLQEWEYELAATMCQTVEEKMEE